MPLVAMNKITGERIDITRHQDPRAELKAVDVVCPECQHPMILKAGLIKIAHFAHKPPTTCEYGKGESEEHRRCKTEIYTELLKLNHLAVELEKKIGNVRPDIFIESKRTGKQYAIEVQLSTLGLDRIMARTVEYARLGVYVLWLPKLVASLYLPVYSPSVWEKWLHAVYFGRIYYWSEGLQIVPVHFDPFKLQVEYSEWYESGGVLVSVGGYERYSKRYRTPRPADPIPFPDAFYGIERQAWRSSSTVVPKCRILVERDRGSKGQ